MKGLLGDTRRYRLWHPRAHLSEAWKDGAPDDKAAGRTGADRYVGRWSIIDEYIGSALRNGSIQFVAAESMGCPPDSDRAVAICARLGAGDLSVDVGWFIHHVRAMPGGAEMRSRFWMGGSHCVVRMRYAPGIAARAVRPIASPVPGAPESAARNLLVHCAQEVNHLAGILPELYQAFGDQ